MNVRPAVVAAVLAAIATTGADALAATCNVDACTAEIQAAAGVVDNSVFVDANMHDAQHLPVYGKIINNWPNCPEQVDFAGAGHSIPPYSCPGQYGGDSTSATVANANTFLGTVDRQWWQPCRLADPTLMDIGGGTMCVKNWSCIADGTGGNYNPWQGLVFDLGGPSNKVAIFAENDHGPQPCESLEYTVFLSDNPYATDTVLHPATDGVDPAKWNRAVLSKIYTGGWIQVRPPDPVNSGATCGDTSQYSVEEDSFVQVFSLPCGVTFRYAAVVAGNDGLDFPSCAYDSNEGEIDAVAGLTESGSAVCPDADHDHYVDCNCPGAPPVCDCNDGDSSIHPGAPEACDAGVDYNCDGNVGTPCAADLVCYQSLCVPTCGMGENPYCPPSTSCKNTPDKGKLCLPDDCGCAPGQVCVNNQCQDACLGVTCPGSQICQDGQCIDPCAGIQCPQSQQCQGGQCVFPCGCFAGNIGCDSMLVCDSTGSSTCVPPACKGVTCAAGQTCDPTSGQCVGICTNVHCPAGQKCDDASGSCVSLCFNVPCTDGLTCDPSSGKCVDLSCQNVTCLPPAKCMGGMCVTPDGGGFGGGGGAGGAGGMGGATESTGSHTGSSSSGGDPGAKGKCGCRTVGEPDEDPIPGAGALALVGLAAAFARRRRA